MSEQNKTEPWLSGTLSEVPAVVRAVMHALELAREDIVVWCGGLSDAELNHWPCGPQGSSTAVAPAAFHVRHIARSIDRLLTYAEGGQLSAAQIQSMKAELDVGAKHDALFAEFNGTLDRALARVRAIGADHLEEERKVGRKELPTSVGGLLIHVAEHTARHVGQAVTTAKTVIAAGEKF